MLSDWFKAREAVLVGEKLADSFSPPFTLETGVSGGSSKSAVARAETLLRRAANEVRALKLNFFKRTKLLASFKWRLVEHGFDGATVDALIRSLLLQITTTSSVPIARPSTERGTPSTGLVGTKRLSSLLSEASARFAERDYVAAAERLQDAVAVDPRNAVAHGRLGAALLNLGEYAQAERELRRALELNTASSDAHLNLGGLLRLKGEFAASETALRRAVKQNPRNPEALVSLGLTLGSRNQLQEAGSAFEKVLRLKPQHAGALCGAAWVASLRGRFEEAETLYRRALDIEPRMPAALAGITELRRMTAADSEWLLAAEGTLAAGMPPSQEARLRFAMGKYFDDLQMFPRAFEQYRRANELCKQVAAPYDRTARKAFVDDMIDVYSIASLARPAAGASASAMPVFVTGMPRSGTTLVDQIIATHPRAVGAGELGFWQDSASKHRDILRRRRPDAELAQKLVGSFLDQLSRHAKNAVRVVDKSNFNWNHLGLINSLLPNARLIYVHRDPLDTCLSCYFQHFAGAVNFTGDLTDLAHYYREHHRLMEHWRSVLPQGTLLEVPYEELVGDQEKWIRRIIGFIGLDWDPRCLEFYNTERSVLTASNWQVRQRIYSNSVGRWKNYERHIGPLLKLRKL